MLLESRRAQDPRLLVAPEALKSREDSHREEVSPPKEAEVPTQVNRKMPLETPKLCWVTLTIRDHPTLTIPTLELAKDLRETDTETNMVTFSILKTPCIATTRTREEEIMARR